MPTLHNPAGHRLFCYRIERILEAGESVEITDEEARDLQHNTVFIVERGEKPEAPVEEKADDASDDNAEQASTPPKRETAKRGSKRVEVSITPDMETRG